MRLKTFLMSAVCSSFLIACQAKDDEKSNRTVSGKYMGDASWEEVPVSEASIDLSYKFDYKFTGVQRRSLPHLRQEILVMKNGVLRLTEFYGYRSVSKRMREDHFKRIFGSMDIVSKNADVDSWYIRNDGRIQWASFKIEQRQCVAASRPLGERRGRGYAAAVTGFICGESNRDTEKVTNEAVRFFESIQMKR